MHDGETPRGTGPLVQRLRPAAGDPEGALVLLHGRATDENDLFPLLDALDPDRRLLGATLRGPLQLPPGGNHWYVVRQIGYPDRDTFFETWPLLTGSIDALLEQHGVAPGRLVVGGFSQGAVMSHALALAQDRPQVAGHVALSGFIPTVDGLDLDPESRAGKPVAIGHGTHDPVITLDFGRAARDRLSAAGLDVTYRESPMPHTVDPDFLAELRPWLATAIS